MERIVLERIPLVFDRDLVMEMHRIRKDSEFGKEFMEMLKIAEDRLRCKAILRWADVVAVKDSTVQINDVVFESRVMADNLKNTDKVFLYILTVGDELDQDTDFDESVIRDMIKGTALYAGMTYLYDLLKEKFGFEQIAAMNPGSLPDWSIENNEKLFELIGNVEEAGAKLNEHHYIIPWNSSSGILFENGDGYLNCALCKNKCEKRRAPFDQREYDRIFTV
ncbi:hypothetical protein J0B03_10625 [Alkalibacter rhizosphaerae]|uniref:Vitamin B12 dependent methionine synthase, activation domain n=1 Tax=Alkalibacter rhizosphaerae TaxID=2815577 RepID=A0A974XLN1_9FIRM|nr:hypothetical protein [Alkalibacter rhizosphaerae]QSX08236.1 hypothetical protein J0B03_10625 [Alkalibacter rhizosphaerae]